MSQYLRPSEVCRLLQVSRETLQKLICSGQLQALRVGVSWRISQEALREFQTRNSASNAANQAA